MTSPIIDASELGRSFGDVAAVDRVDLAIEPGEIYGFLGPNGAGKSTTVRMLCTLLLPTTGSARVAGYDVVDQAGDVRVRMGVALQESSLDEKQSGKEILELQGRLYGLSGSALAERMEAVAELVDIGDALEARVGTYSGGMKRRLDLAAALIHEPEVVFLDEPTTGLDPISRTRVWDEVRRLNEGLGVTIFLTTQYLEEADELADRVGIIDDGRIVAEGTPIDLKREIGQDLVIAAVDRIDAGVVGDIEAIAGVSSVHTHDGEVSVAAADGAAVVGDIAVILAGAGANTTSITVRSPSLDDVFLEATGHRIEEVEEGEDNLDAEVPDA